MGKCHIPIEIRLEISKFRLEVGDINSLATRYGKLALILDATLCCLREQRDDWHEELRADDIHLIVYKIDLFGVGERLITARSEPVFGGVYKLVAVEDENGEIIPKIKVSENVEKITVPHFKKLWRFYGNDTGKAIADYMTVYDETVDDSGDLEIFDPYATWKKKVVYDFNAKELLVPIFLNGKRVYDSPSLQEIQDYCREQVDTLWDEVKRFDNPHRYYVDLSDNLWTLKQEMLRGRR